MTTIAVLGAGSWGTTLADLLGRKGQTVRLWAHEPEVVAAVNAGHENPIFLPGCPLSEAVVAVADPVEACRGAEVVLAVAPSHVLRRVVERARPGIADGALLVSATKGIENDTLALMSQILTDVLPGRPVCALSGPSFALEVYQQQPTAVVAAASDEAAAREAQQVFSTSRFRVYSHTDVIGVELSGALKNVIAIAAGILEGLGLGNNPRAALITRGLAEMTRLGVATGCGPAHLRRSGRHGRPHPHRHRRPEPEPGSGHGPRRGPDTGRVHGRPPVGGRGSQHRPGSAGAGEAGGCGAADLRPGLRDPVRWQAGEGGGDGPHGTNPQSGAVALTMARPVQEFFSIGEVCALTDLKPHVLRYWESQFRFLNPAKNRSGNRVYKSREVELIMLVKHLLYTEKYTIEGARQRIEHYRRTGELRGAARGATERETLRELRESIEEITLILDGKVPPPRPEPAEE